MEEEGPTALQSGGSWSRPALSLTTAEAAPPKSGVANTAWLLITPDSDSALDFAGRHSPKWFPEVVCVGFLIFLAALNRAQG